MESGGEKKLKKKDPLPLQKQGFLLPASRYLSTPSTTEWEKQTHRVTGRRGSGLKTNKKVLWDYFRTYRADQRVKCETAQRARFGYIHDVSLGKERLQGPRSATLSAPTPNTLSSSLLPLPT